MKYAHLREENKSTWFGNHSTERVIHIGVYKTPEKTGWLADTLPFPTDMFCDVNSQTHRYELKKEWEWTELMKSNSNCGSFSKFSSVKEDAMQLLSDHFKNNGYTVIIEEAEEVKKESEEERKMNNYLNV